MGKKDPVLNYEAFLVETGVITKEEVESYREEIKQEIQAGLDIAFAEEKLNLKLSLK